MAARAPLLAVSSLRGADGVDDTAVKFLLRAELKKKKKEEEERKQVLADEALDEKLDAEMDALMAIGPERLTSRQQARLSAVLRERAELVERRKKRRTMRKRKKRSKRKLPKSSSGVRVRRCGQGSRSRSSSSCGCGRLCEHARQVPAVAGLQWKVPPSISPTMWWTFQLCYGDRYGYGPEGQLQWRECWFCWLQYTSRCVLLPRSPAHDARHHGRYGPFGSAAPLCCESVGVAMSCGGGFPPGGAYGSVWNSVKPMTGKFFLFPVPRGCWVCLHAEWLVQQQRRGLRRQLHLLPVQVAGSQ